MFIYEIDNFIGNLFIPILDAIGFNHDKFVNIDKFNTSKFVKFHLAKPSRWKIDGKRHQ